MSKTKTGDRIKITEDMPHNKKIKVKTTIGIIKQINKHNIVILRLHDDKETYLVSFNIADCKDEKKHFYISNNEKWKPIKIKVIEFNKYENDIGRGKGGKYA